MDFSSSAFILMSLIAMLAIALWWYPPERMGSWLPRELRSAKLVYAERLVTAREPFAMRARLDRAYRDKDGIVILLELKTRTVNRPFLSDIIELSVQRLALMASGSDLVAEYGYVLVQRSAGANRTSHRVRLLPEEDIIALMQRREALLRGQVSATYACTPSICRTCAFKKPCVP